MHKVYVELSGGIGNQLFQIAAAYAYAKRANGELILDDSKWSASQGSSPSCYRKNILSGFLFGTCPTSNITHITEKRFNYDEIEIVDDDVCLHGYFQSFKYFQTYSDELKTIFDSNLSTYNTLPSFIENNNVAVHIRRGDYLNHHHIHMVCDSNFFISNIESFDAHQINIFTDSCNYVANEFPNLNANIIQTKSDIDSLELMSLHDNIICSNSSFSWWASFLKKKKKKIIVPDRWFNNFEPHHDIYRDDFTIIPA